MCGGGLRFGEIERSNATICAAATLEIDASIVVDVISGGGDLGEDVRAHFAVVSEFKASHGETFTHGRAASFLAFTAFGADFGGPPAAGVAMAQFRQKLNLFATQTWNLKQRPPPPRPSTFGMSVQGVPSDCSTFEHNRWTLFRDKCLPDKCDYR